MAKEKQNPPRTSFSLFPEDEEIINQISRVTGIRAKTDCIRYALTQWARQHGTTLPANGKQLKPEHDQLTPSA